MLVPAGLPVFRRVDSIQSDVQFAAAQRIAIDHLERARPQIKPAEVFHGRQHKGDGSKQDKAVDHALVEGAIFILTFSQRCLHPLP